MAPRSIAVVGANERPGSYASQALLNLDAIGFGGEVWGVNPNRGSALGRPCVPSVSDLPCAVDAVVVAIPAAGVPGVIEEAGNIRLNKAEREATRCSNIPVLYRAGWIDQFGVVTKEGRAFLDSLP